jgi:hypothetical protein
VSSSRSHPPNTWTVAKAPKGSTVFNQNTGGTSAPVTALAAGADCTTGLGDFGITIFDSHA